MMILKHSLPVCFLHAFVERIGYKSFVHIGVCMSKYSFHPVNDLGYRNFSKVTRMGKNQEEILCVWMWQLSGDMSIGMKR